MQGSNVGIRFTSEFGEEFRYFPSKTYKFNYPKTYLTLRKNKSYCKEYLIDKMIIHLNLESNRTFLSDQLKNLPLKFIECLYEFGVEISVVSQAELDQKYIRYKNKKLYGNLEQFENTYNCGFYLKGAKLAGIHPKMLYTKDFRPIIYYLARAYQHAIGSYPELINLPNHLITYENLYRPAYVINYALRYGEDYFPYCFFYYFNDEFRKEKLKNEDRVMFRFIELLLDMWE